MCTKLRMSYLDCLEWEGFLISESIYLEICPTELKEICCESKYLDLHCKSDTQHKAIDIYSQISPTMFKGAYACMIVVTIKKAISGQQQLSKNVAGNNR